VVVGVACSLSPAGGGGERIFWSRSGGAERIFGGTQGKETKKNDLIRYCG